MNNKLLLIVLFSCFFSACESFLTDPYAKGIELSEGGKYHEAITFFDAMINENPKDSKAFTNRGKCKHQLGDFEGANSDFTKSIQIAPSSAATFHNRGLNTMFNNQDLESALADFEKAIEIDSSYYKAYCDKGNILRDLGSFPESIVALSKAIEINALDGDSFTNRGRTYLNANEFENALKDFQEAIRLNPKDSYAYYLCGFAKLELDDLDGACQDWQKANDLDLHQVQAVIEKYCT